MNFQASPSGAVVTASTHINVGIPDPDQLIAAYRVLRAEASMYLALTASSPFLRGKPTGAHSQNSPSMCLF